MSTYFYLPQIFVPRIDILVSTEAEYWKGGPIVVDIEYYVANIQFWMLNCKFWVSTEAAYWRGGVGVVGVVLEL